MTLKSIGAITVTVAASILAMVVVDNIFHKDMMTGYVGGSVTVGLAVWFANLITGGTE